MEAFKFSVRQIAKGLKEEFDANEGNVNEYDIPSKPFELVITREGEGENGQYNITLDLYEEESGFEKIEDSGGASELRDFENIIKVFIENGGCIEDMHHLVKEK